MQTTTKKIESSTLHESYYCIHHKSGLDLYVIPKNLSTTYALFATKFGSIDRVFRLSGEDAYTTVPDGIAHFLEHKLFEAEDGSDTNERFAKLGASCNAFTSSDTTAYEFSTTGNPYDALAVLLDFVTHPYFTDENVKKEQGIIGQEIRGCDDNPMRRLYYELLALLYQNNNVKINICGTCDTIATITPKILYSCYNTFYRLSNMALVISGDLDYEKVIAVADKYLPVQNIAIIDRYFEAEPNDIAKKRSALSMAVGRPIFAIGFKDNDLPKEGDALMKRILTFKILSYLLFSSSTDFCETMLNEGIVSPGMSDGYEFGRNAGFYLISGESDVPETVYDRVIAMLEEKKKNPPSKEDFERSKRVLYAEQIRVFDATDTIVNDFLFSCFSEFEYLKTPEVFATIRYEDALDLLSSFFNEKTCAMAVINPMTTEEK